MSQPLSEPESTRSAVNSESSDEQQKQSTSPPQISPRKRHRVRRKAKSDSSSTHEDQIVRDRREDVESFDDIDAATPLSNKRLTNSRPAPPITPPLPKAQRVANWLKAEWCYMLGLVIAFIAVIVVGILPLQLNEVQIWQEPTIWFTTVRVTCVVDTPTASFFNASTSSFAKLFAPLNVTDAQVKLRRINLWKAAVANATATNVTATTSDSTIEITLSTTSIDASLTATTITENAVNATGSPSSTPAAISNNKTMNATAIAFTVQADIAMNGTRNFTVDEFTAAWDANDASIRNAAFGTNTSIRATGWTIALVSPAPAPKLPAKLFKPWKAWLTLWVIFVMVAALARHGVVDPDVAIFAALTILCVTQVITPTDVVSGFANEGIATVGVLFVVAKGIANSGVLEVLMKYLLGTPRNVRVALARMAAPLVLHGFFITNTPLVAIMIPIVQRWSRRIHIPASLLLMPLSTLTILGGTLTLIGTSTNLVVQGLAIAKKPDLILPFFDIALVGLPTLAIGIVYVILLAPVLLPKRETAAAAFEQNPREYVIAARVPLTKSTIVGKTIEEAGLRQLPNLFVVELRRSAKIDQEDAETTIITAPPPTTTLAAGDVLMFAGDVSSVNDLWEHELHPATDEVDKLVLSADGSRSAERRQVVEAVVSPSSPFIGSTVREAKFRQNYSAAIIAVHRAGERVMTRIADLELKPGDNLLLECGEAFISTHKNSTDFQLVSVVGDSSRVARQPIYVMAITVLLVASMIAVAAVQSLGTTFLVMALLVSFAMWILGTLTVHEARVAVNLPVMVMIAGSIGFSTAVENSGLSRAIALNLIDLLRPLGDLGLVFSIYIAIAVLNAIVSNKASVSLIFPIGWQVALSSKTISIRTIIYTCMLSGSADFATPIGYPTNLMVFSLGGYKFGDYAKFGVMLQIVVCLISTPICYYAYME